MEKKIHCHTLLWSNVAVKCSTVWHFQKQWCKILPYAILYLVTPSRPYWQHHQREISRTYRKSFSGSNTFDHLHCFNLSLFFHWINKFLIMKLLFTHFHIILISWKIVLYDLKQTEDTWCVQIYKNILF